MDGWIGEQSLRKTESRRRRTSLIQKERSASLVAWAMLYL